MTKINKIVASGFKSFAKWTEFPFSGDYNVVLGPNGSGKSNLLDALCFVLGRTSSKSMRAEKLAHLIYNGGKSKKPAGKAEVSIYFDNSSKLFQRDDPEIKITRGVKQNGQGVYRINDERCTRQQVIDLMSLAKIDPDGHNIILQGDIVRFVEMSSEESRQVIEEAAGISVYEDKKQKAMTELGHVEERLKEADIILSERKGQLKELKEDRDQALKYKDVNDKIKQTKATHLSLQVKRLEKQKGSVDEETKAQKKQIDALQDSITAEKKQAEERKLQIKALNEQIEEKGEKEQLSLHKSIEEIKVLLATDNHRISYCDSESRKMEDKKSQLQSELSDFEKKIEGLKSSKIQIEKSIAEKGKDVALLEKNIEKFRKTHNIENLSGMDFEIEKLDKESEEKQNELQKLVEQKQNLLREKDRLEIQMQSIDERVSKVLEVEKESKEGISGLKKLREDFKRMVVELNQAISNDSVLAAQIFDTRKKLNAAEEQLARLKARSIGIRERVQSNVAVRRLIEQKSIKGIFGLISELGTVKSTYSLAMEVAAGPRLHSLVVEDEKVAAECIEYLKKNRLGIATFLPLTKLRQKKESEIKIKDAKGVHDFAIELISYDRKFKKAFEYVFGDTIVVDNMDVARRMGIGRARMVTLEGDLCELSGAIQGGFRQKIGSFKEDELNTDLKESEKSISQYEELLESLEKKRAQNETAITELRKKKGEHEAEIAKDEKMLHLEADDLEASKGQKQKLEANAKNIDSELNIIQLKFNEYSRQVSELKSKRQKLREQISELRNPALIAEINAFEQKRNEVKSEILKLENELKSLATQTELFENEKKKISSLTKQVDKEKESLYSEKAGLMKKMEGSAANLKQLEEKANAFYSNFRQLFSQRNRLGEELQKIEESIVRKEEQIRSSEIKMNNISLKMAEFASELAALNREFEQYRDVNLLEEKDEAKLKADAARYEKGIMEMGNVNLKALEVYDEVEKQYNALLEKRDKLNSEKDAVVSMMNEIESRKKELFMKSFNTINENFRRIFLTLSTKGDAHLFLENEENPFDAGLRIRVRLTGEKFLDIRSLSGGEKTMTALAFIFAIQEYNPASFYVLDEVDAALDKRNSEKLSGLIKKYSEKAQYIVISHNDAVITEATTLYGVSMDENGASNVVSLKV